MAEELTLKKPKQITWVRVDAAFASNHKVLGALSERGGDHAICVYVFALGYCASQGTDGFIPEIALGLIHGRKRDAEILVANNFWNPVQGGWEINDYLDFQPSTKESNARTLRAKEAAAKRWQKTSKESK